MSYANLGVSPGWGGFVVEAFGEVVDHGDGDHAGGVAGSGFVVTHEAAVMHEPTYGALNDPPPLDDRESFDSRVFGNDLDVDAKTGTVFDDGGLEPCVHPCLGQKWDEARSPR
jgi:hypothetical protein